MTCRFDWAVEAIGTGPGFMVGVGAGMPGLGLAVLRPQDVGTSPLGSSPKRSRLSRPPRCWPKPGGAAPAKPALARLLAMCDVEPMTEEQAAHRTHLTASSQHPGAGRVLRELQAAADDVPIGSLE